MDERANLDRRELLKVGAVAAAAAILPASARATGPADGLPPADTLLGAGSGPGPVALFAPVDLGGEVAHGWILADVRAPDRGALLVVLRRGDARARIHVCRNDGCPAGVARTDALDFLLMNGGRGHADSDEQLGLAVLRLAELARANAAAVDAATLLPHEERVARFAQGAPGALR